MAMRRNIARVGERGLSVIEALVIVTVTALLALLLLPLASRAAGRNFALAERSLDAADAAVAERQVRALLRAGEQRQDGAPSIVGRADSVTLFPALTSALACAPAGASWVRLRIVRRAGEGRLVCESVGRRTDLLRWSAGDARFSYSADGAAWRSIWSETPAPLDAATAPTRTAPLVRFEVLSANGHSVVWLERAGWTEARAQDVDGAAARPASLP